MTFNVSRRKSHHLIFGIWVRKDHANLFTYNSDLGVIILLRTSKYQSKSEVLILNQQCMMYWMVFKWLNRNWVVEKHNFDPQECGSLVEPQSTPATSGRLWGDATLGFEFVNTAETRTGLDHLAHCFLKSCPCYYKRVQFPESVFWHIFPLVIKIWNGIYKCFLYTVSPHKLQ